MPVAGNALSAGNSISFYVNGKQHVVALSGKYTPTTSLNDYLRGDAGLTGIKVICRVAVALSGKYTPTTSLNDYLRGDAGLTGTKVMCREAGCGCCAVTVTTQHPSGNGHITRTINSCLCPLLSVDGWQVTTVEGLGSEKDGFHPIQSRVAQFNGTQCGYCTPGMVMAMYGLLSENPRPSQQEVEDNFDGNICRCTGYRSILDAMKSFAADTTISGGGVIDIEDLNKHLCPRTGQPCPDDHSNGTVKRPASDTANGGVAKRAANGAAIGAANGSTTMGSLTGLHVRSGQREWFRPTCLQELGSVLRNTTRGETVRLLFGNTSAGIYKNEGPFDVYVDLREVRELYEITVRETSVKVGANTSLTDLMQTLKQAQDTQDGFGYFGALVSHLQLVGNVLMRNAASVAGNLMIKHAHHDFPSDVFTMSEAAGGKVEVFDSKDSSRTMYSLVDFVRRVSMKGKVLTALELPALDLLDTYRSFKITPRSQNAHAYVNAAFKMKVSQGNQILGKPSIVIGGISNTLFHAERTEEYLRGKTLKDEVVKEALAMLRGEVKPTADPVLASPQYRRDLAVNLLYKTLLGIVSPTNSKLASGSSNLERPLSSGVQTWKDKTEEWPLKQPLPKKTATLQASGEAEYVNDIPAYKQELCGAMVVTTLANAVIDSVDPSPALAMEGVEGYITHTDIPSGGINNAFANLQTFPLPPEEVFCTGQVQHAGQVVGMILAETQALADEAAQKVVVKYKDVKPPILTIEQALEANSVLPCFIPAVNVGSPEEALAKSARTVEGEVRIGQQYHFYMETIASLSVPTEEGMEVYLTTQFADCVQVGVAGVLNKPQNYVNVHVPRLGGSFGGKALTPNHVALATSVAAYSTGRPIRSSLSLSTTMKNAGKRAPMLAKYKVGFSESGKLEVVIVDLYVDNGMNNNLQFMVMEVCEQLDQGYYSPNWKLTPTILKTNKPSGAFVRGPGTTPAATIIETIMEHVAKAVGKHPILVKEMNLYKNHQKDITGSELLYCTMPEVWDRLKHKADVYKRMEEVDTFNKNNQWKKRGITMSAVKYGMSHFDHGFPLLLSVYAHDGSVTVVQGGVEMGQGLYMKVAQAVAHGLGIPVEMVKVRPSLSYVTPNASVTGGSTGSEKAVLAALEACRVLQEKLEPIRAKLPDADWQTLVKAALKAKIDLAVKSTPFKGTRTTDGPVHHDYFTYCAGVVETQLDVLTGEYAISRVDIMFDCGESLNPMIDMGQIEGAFVFGLGFNLLEDIIYDKDTGVTLNDGTWEYKPPTTKDIPIDWRIHLLPDAPNPVGVRSSKASGEPPTGLSAAAMLSLKLCAEEAAKDLTGSSDFVPVAVPFTVEKLQQSVGVQVEHLSL